MNPKTVWGERESGREREGERGGGTERERDNNKLEKVKFKF